MTFIVLAAHESDATVFGNSLVILVSFIILLLLLKRFALGPLMAMIEKRETQISDDLDKAATAKNTALEHEKEAKQSIFQAQQKAQQLVNRAKESSEKIKTDAAIAAREETIRIRHEAELAIEQERQNVMAELKTQVAGLSVELTKKLLKRELSAQDHQVLIDAFIEGLED